MKFVKALIFLILIVSCSSKKSKNLVSEFDKILGEENILTLDTLILDFENDFLKNQYPNLKVEKAYHQFLIESRDEEADDWKDFPKKSKEKFILSDLRLEIYKYPDSVWMVKNSDFDKIDSDSIVVLNNPFPYLTSRYKSIIADGTVSCDYSRDSGYNDLLTRSTNYDSITSLQMNNVKFNSTGKYIQALQSIKDRSKFHKEFYNMKNGSGMINPRVIASGMLYTNIDLSDVLNRKINVL